MDNHKLNNIGDPSADGDVVTREYVDRSVRDTCDAVKADWKEASEAAALFLKHDNSSIMTGSLSMGGHSVANVGEIISAQDVAIKNYTDSLIGLTHLDMKGKNVTY